MKQKMLELQTTCTHFISYQLPTSGTNLENFFTNTFIKVATLCWRILYITKSNNVLQSKE